MGIHTLKKKSLESDENLFRRPQAPHLFERNDFRLLSSELQQTKIIPLKQMRRLRVAKQIFV